MPAKKFRSIVIDTVNGIQQSQYMRLSKKADFDQWLDFGKDIYNTLAHGKQLNPRDVYPILILGKEGTGKTISISYLNSEETYYVNADRKPMSFPGWRKKYIPGKISEGGNYNDTIEEYDDLQALISTVYDNRKEGPFFVFFLAHVEDYKTVNGAVGQKMKTLGKVASKHGVEGAVVHSYYTDIDTNKPLNDSTRYRLRTANSGYDTARTPLSYWNEIYIPNNAQRIIDRVTELEY